jgi:hypothetical protein
MLLFPEDFLNILTDKLKSALIQISTRIEEDKNDRLPLTCQLQSAVNCVIYQQPCQDHSLYTALLAAKEETSKEWIIFVNAYLHYGISCLYEQKAKLEGSYLSNQEGHLHQCIEICQTLIDEEFYAAVKCICEALDKLRNCLVLQGKSGIAELIQKRRMKIIKERF